jgi:hypothetical protein
LSPRFSPPDLEERTYGLAGLRRAAESAHARLRLVSEEEHDDSS